ncbi:helix-turn-helix transcriptional regulator, partial [Staphylococcus hominis]|nr:helix-turn-helix transcriptional regulator [Staphylococcus hominis]
MNIGQQIRKYRERDEYSQEYLAEKLYVSRQTISNWENEKSYPDIHNLLVMCELFDISLDDLVRGDLNSNKQESIKRKMNIWSLVMIIGFTLSSILIGPLLYYFNSWGFIIIAILFLISFYSGTQIDKIKYKYNLDNYDRIVAFMNGKDP